MQLRRVTHNAFDPSVIAIAFTSDDFTFYTLAVDEPPQSTDVVKIDFPRFGEGAKRQSDFEVCAEWKDVQRMIDIFCENAQPEAIAIRDALRLASAAQRAGWQPPQSK